MSEPGAIGVEARARVEADRVEVLLRLRIPENTHIEAHEPPEPMLIPTVAHFDDLEVSRIDYPDPIEKDLGLPGPPLRVYEGSVHIRAEGRAGTDLDAVSGTVSYQPCVGGACLPPREQAWRAPIERVTRRE